MNRYFIFIKNIDNQLTITLDGNLLYDSGNISGDPPMNHPIEITTMLQANPYVNSVQFNGFNSHYAPGHPGGANQDNPWHFSYTIEVGHSDSNGNFVSDGLVVPAMDASGVSKKDTWIFYQPYVVVKEPGSSEFKFQPVSSDRLPYWTSKKNK